MSNVSGIDRCPCKICSMNPCTSHPPCHPLLPATEEDTGPLACSLARSLACLLACLLVCLFACRRGMVEWRSRAGQTKRDREERMCSESETDRSAPTIFRLFLARCSPGIPCTHARKLFRVNKAGSLALLPMAKSETTSTTAAAKYLVGGV